MVSLLALIGVSVSLRTTAMDTSYWIDEGIATGIARYPLWDIPSQLLLDGSPPLYYMLLHIWESWFGTSELATRSLSLTAAVMTIPVAWVLARAIAGNARGVDRGAARGGPSVLDVLRPGDADVRARGASGVGARWRVVLIFTQRRRRWIPVAVVAGAALVYTTHNWGLFALVRALARPSWRCLRAAGAVAVVGDRWRDRVRGDAVLYLPWVPSLLKQASSTGAPWSRQPGVTDLFLAIVVPFGYEVTGVVLALITALAAVRIATRRRDGIARRRVRRCCWWR